MVSYIVSLLFISFCLMNNSYALGGRNISQNEYVVFDVTSFLSASCKSSVSGHKSRPSSLKVTHRYGHCSKSSLNDNNSMPSLAEILAIDQIRVASIQNRRAIVKNLYDSKSDVLVKSGRPYGVINYVVSVGLGTPVKYVTLSMDTGSSLTWTQCKPCTRLCHTQNDPIFDPSASTSYSNSACSSIQCSKLSSLPYYRHNCTRELTCIYGVGYGDDSISFGNLASETLTLTRNEVFDRYSFGCGQINVGIFGTTAGILGLGGDYFSLVSQTASKYGKYFSYCLPSQSGSNGHLTLGKDSGGLSNLVFTSLLNDPRGEFYLVNIEAIIVGGTRLAINASVFKAGGRFVVDSGTSLTYLPPTAYIALTNGFRQKMSQYNHAVRPSSGTISCYDFSNIRTILIPRISFVFVGNARVDIDPIGTFLHQGNSIFCLAFGSIKADAETGIFGNLQQQTLEVVYDVAGGRIGFGSHGCS